ncbi:Tricorn protease homolog 1 [Rubrivivax sp. A210]|uniref:S41 family peptidase n=1 Tax=Rubrivivax sp. A210 TaxID=2772301 RepID=UPI001917DEB7|nr:S41 family peptidase [Rubrivivax sp. A210]CAD5373291.1 Tricorn protease homolog 1 [Rubrivivax sp. A210]
MSPDTPPAAPPVVPPPAYFRQPGLQGETVVFVADDDLWRASIHGGPAQRLSAGLSEPATPCLSPCGQWLAFAGRDEQHSEVWLMPAVGGPARRLSWLGSELAVRGFLPDGRILFTSNHGQPFFRNGHAWAVSPAGGLPERLPLGQVQHLAFGPGGRRVIGRNTADPARWKRYRGGTAGHLWVEDDESGGTFTRLAGLKGNLTCPMWLNGRIYFLGDGEGVGNLYSVLPDGSGLRRHSDHADFYARHAACDGRRIVYQCGAELWLYDPVDDRTRRLDIAVPSARTQAARRFVPAAEHLQGLALHPAGHSLALEARGQLFTMALWEGAVRRHGLAPARRRLGQWLADGERLVATSDASGEDRIELLGPAGVRELPWDAFGRPTALATAPTGARLALANHRNELWLGDVDSGSLSLVDRSEFGRIEGPAWSPCAGWLAYTYPTSARHTAIKLFEVASGRSLLATEPAFRDWAPAFDPSGRYLYFLSLRTFDPVYDAVQFDLSFPRAARPYLLALQAGGPPLFEPAPRGMKSEEPAAGADAKAPLPAIEPEGLARRVAAFPVPEGRFGQIAGVAGGKVIWTALPIPGAHGRGGHKESPGRLEVYDLASGELKTLAAQADAFVIAADHQTLLVRTGQKLRALDAAKAPEDKPAAADDKPSRKSGHIDLARVRLAVDPPQEWAQILREVWRLQRDHFWVEDMSGVAWTAMLERYAPLLARVATRGELSDLIWELQGELGTSHAYEMGGDHRKPPAVALGHLAADLKPAANGWEIMRTVQGDAWDATADSPLNAVGVQVRPGEAIVAVGGQPVSAEQPPQALLVNQAGAKVALTLAAADGSTREVLVTALADETPARYREWVERNRAWVHAAGGGRVGYLHLPDMMSAGFAEFHRAFAAESDRDALIVDLRYNRGGHVSQLLLEKVARRRIAWNTLRWGQPESYPDAAPTGAVVALTNEHAGSDGDIFSHGFKLMGLGTLVGMRTWGGVIGIWPRHALVDGTLTTQPEYSFWFKDVGWGVENYGTDPQIEVDNAPQDDAFNAPERDRQLAAALAEALAARERVGVARPAFGPRPRLAAPQLPPRPQ